MDPPFIVHWHLCKPNVCANNVYEAQMCTSFYYLLKHWQVYRTMTLWKNSEGCITWSKRVFSKQYTFPCYRASQSRGSTRWPQFTACVKHMVISIYLNSVCYLILYTRVFTKLNLFEILLYVTFITMKVSRSMVWADFFQTWYVC